MRTFLILMLLLGSGLVCIRLTAKAATIETPQPIVEKMTELIPAKFYLTLSKNSGTTELICGDQLIELSTKDHTHFSGSGAIDPRSPVLFLKISTTSTEPRANLFAKLVVEAEGKETFTHVFDAPGDIDDFIELPF